MTQDDLKAMDGRYDKCKKCECECKCGELIVIVVPFLCTWAICSLYFKGSCWVLPSLFAFSCPDAMLVIGVDG